MSQYSNQTDELLKAYQQALYWLEAGPRKISLTVGESSSQLDQLLIQHHANGGALISAFNPASIPLSDSENAERHQNLKNKLEKSGYQFYPTGSRDKKHLWPLEKGFFVISIDLADAVILAEKFGQHAILYHRAFQPVELVWTNSTG